MTKGRWPAGCIHTWSPFYCVIKSSDQVPSFHCDCCISLERSLQLKLLFTACCESGICETLQINTLYRLKCKVRKVKRGFHMIFSNVRIVSVTEFLVTQSGRKDRTRFYRDDRFASDVRIVWNNRKSVSIWSYRSLGKTYCDRDDPYVRDECMETRLNRPDHLTSNSVTETILSSETMIWKPG